MGAALRLYDLGGASLWMDEGFTWMRASGGALPLDLDKHPPLYYALVRALLAFGQSEWAVRLPAALAGIASIAAVFALGREAYGWREAGIAATLLALSGLHVLMSRDGRGYAVAALLLTVATLYWLRLLRDPEAGPRVLTGWYAAALLAIYTHYLTFFALGLQWGIALVADRRRDRWIALAALLAVAYLPWIPSLLTQARTPSPGHYPPNLLAVCDVLFSQAAGFCLNFRWIGWWYLLAALAAALALAPALLERGPSRQLAALTLGTVAVIMGVSRLTGMGLFETKYMVLVAPLFWLLTARALSLLGERQRLSAAALLLLLGAINVTSSCNSIAFAEWGRQDFRWAARQVQERARPGDLILLEPDWATAALAFYAPRLHVIPLDAGRVGAFAAPAGAHRIWLVRADASLSDPADRVKGLLDATFPKAKEWTAWRRNHSFDVHVTLYERE